MTVSSGASRSAVQRPAVFTLTTDLYVISKRAKAVPVTRCTNFSKAFSIFKTTAAPQHTRECNFDFVDMQLSIPNFTQTCQGVSTVAQ